jgi:hypothetical protein
MATVPIAWHVLYFGRWIIWLPAASFLEALAIIETRTVRMSAIVLDSHLNVSHPAKTTSVATRP